MADLVVVTGASGFVAKHVIAQALEAGYRVRGTLRDMAKADGIAAALRGHVGDLVDNLEFAKADLLNVDGWGDAFEGAIAVLHTAMVVTAIEPHPSKRDDVLKPAIDGTRYVLEAAKSAGVSRIVMTSSIATVGYGRNEPAGEMHLTEENWTDPDGVHGKWTYSEAKTRAELYAWEFAKQNNIELTTICPSMILGPALDDDAGVSIDAVGYPMRGQMPFMLPGGFAAIDVRDVAEMHVKALSEAWTKGQRVLCAGDYMTFSAQMDVLRKHYPDRKFATFVIPKGVIRFFGMFSRSVRQLMSDMDTIRIYDRTRGEKLLGRPLRSGEEAVHSAAESLIKLGLA